MASSMGGRPPLRPPPPVALLALATLAAAASRLPLPDRLLLLVLTAAIADETAACRLPLLLPRCDRALSTAAISAASCSEADRRRGGEYSRVVPAPGVSSSGDPERDRDADCSALCCPATGRRVSASVCRQSATELCGG